MLDNSIVGSQIAFLRRQNGYTQDELAEKLGITAQAISKWENGHTLPETSLLPQLAQLLNHSIDSILLPLAARDSAFQNFAHGACGKYEKLATKLYQRLAEKFFFTVDYDEAFYIFEDAHEGASAKCRLPEKEDFILRIDVSAEAGTGKKKLDVRIPLIHCANYMDLADEMPEHIKRAFRINDCKSCTCNCPFCMAYTFEGTDYKQCHFISIGLDSEESVEHILALVCAEHETASAEKVRV